MFALVDNRQRVKVLMRHDKQVYSFKRMRWEPAHPGMYLVECWPDGKRSELPCQHVIHESRITLLPEPELHPADDVQSEDGSEIWL